MRIGFSTGYRENFWGDWFTAKQIGGSERIVVEVSAALAAQGHSVTVRLPYQTDERVFRGVRWLGVDATEQHYDLLFCADDFRRRDNSVRSVLVACRSDPPPHTDFDQLIFLSRHHAELMGHPDRPFVGGGVDLADYENPKVRLPRRVICTSSPDRCSGALAIGKSFDFVHSYKKIADYPSVELTREGLIDLQQTARVMVYPLDPRRPSDFWSMACAESCAAGTPLVISDADALPEVWGEVAVVLPRPINYAQWWSAVNDLLTDKAEWEYWSRLGLLKARDLTWTKQSQRYLAAALEA